MSHAGDMYAPMRPGPDGARDAPCPACLAGVAVPGSAGGWVRLRCPSCGIEFVATDGTTPEPPRPRGTGVAVADETAGGYSVSCPACGLAIPVGRDRIRKGIRLTCPECGEKFKVRKETDAPPEPPARPEPSPAPTGLGGLWIARCPECEAHIVVTRSGGAKVRCRACGVEFDPPAEGRPWPRPSPKPPPPTILPTPKPPPRTGPPPPKPPPPTRPPAKPPGKGTRPPGKKVKCPATATAADCPDCGRAVPIPVTAATDTVLTCAGCGTGFVVSFVPVVVPRRPRPEPRRPAPKPLAPPTPAPAAAPPTTGGTAACPICGTPDSVPLGGRAGPVQCRECGIELAVAGGAVAGLAAAPPVLPVVPVPLVPLPASAVPGARTAVCPACRRRGTVPGTSPRARVRCANCNAEFVFAEGATPVAPPPKPPVPVPPPRPPVPRPPAPAPPKVEPKWVRCPFCHRLAFFLPTPGTSAITLTCGGCGREFVADLRSGSPRPTPVLPGKAPAGPSWLDAFRSLVKWYVRLCILAPIGVLLLWMAFKIVFGGRP